MRRSSLPVLVLLAALGCRHDPKPTEGEDAPPYPLADEAWRIGIRERLHATRVSEEFPGVPLERVLDGVCGQARVHARIDPEILAEKKDDLEVVHARFDGCPADDALDAILEPLGLAWGLRDEFVYVARPDRLPPAPEKEAAAERIRRAKEELAAWPRRQAAEARLDRLVLDVDWEDVPLESVLEDLSRRGAVPIRLDRPSLAPPKGSPGVTMRGLHGVRAVNLLSIVLSEHGLGTTWRGAEVRVVPRAEADVARKLVELDEEVGARRVSLDVAKATLRDLRTSLEKAAGVPVLIDEATWNRQDRVTLCAKDVEVREILRSIRDEGRCATMLWEGTIYLLAPPE